MSAKRVGIQRVRSTSESETERYGRELGFKIRFGACVSLAGTLGAGKTILARGLCRGLGIDEEILSPTFVLYEEFQGRLPVIHLDLYRLEHESEVEALGIFEKLREGFVVIAEWGDRSDLILDASDIVITLYPVREAEREIEIEYSDRVSEFFL